MGVMTGETVTIVLSSLVIELTIVGFFLQLGHRLDQMNQRTDKVLEMLASHIQDRAAHR